MDVDHLRFFVEVARDGSFAGVARAHDLDPSLVSRAIAALETELGVRLFQRSTRRVRLTEAGERYLRRVEVLVDELDRAHDEARTLSSEPVGTLRLTASVAFTQVCLVPLVPEFRSLFPKLKLELLITDTNLDLVAERVDLAIRLGPQVAADVVRTKLFDTRYRVCASPAYLKRAGPLNTPEHLSAHRCLLFSLPEFRSRWLFCDCAGVLSEVAIAGDIVTSNALVLRECVLAGLGPALLANWLIDRDLAEGRLVDLFAGYRVTATNFETAAWLLYPSRAFLPGKVRVAIDFLQSRLRG
jgi:DNA-binding transcriptional LysR family regulator